ncbi:hypothetical protein H4R18_004417 [Coemansia javaensis]|uniref:YjgF-like protein n=1 Tax=Coemansia javaensis TaxID=2761396 RepID=A0A9W8H7U6_9FUNG|nr:hypothetical protein H4R18_004417 [Coemansia javaensis]
MSRKVIATANAPAAIGPYSQAIASDGLVFLAGQIPINPATSKIEAQDIAGQTEQVLKNIKAVLEEAGSGIEHVVKTTCFLADINELAAMSEVYAKVFHTDPPARSSIQVARLPLDAKIEIEVIAKVPRSD